MVIKQMLELLAEKDALLVEFKEVPLMSQVELTRRWNRVTDKTLSDARTFLETYTSAANAAQAEAGQARYFVDNPQADNQVMPGRWRLVSVMDVSRRQPPNRAEDQIAQGVVQVLRRGYATTLNLDEAQLVNERENEETTLNSLRTLRWVNIDPTALQAVADSVADSYATLTVRGETLTGTWYLVGKRIHWAEDGSGIIEAKYATAGWTWTQDEWAGALIENSTTLYMDVPQALVQGIVTGYSGTQLPGVTVNVRVQDKASGLYDITVTTTTVEVRELDYTVGYEEESAEDIEMRWNISRATLEGLLVSYALSEEGKEKSVSVNLNQNDSYDFVGRVRRIANNGASFGTTVGSEWNVSTRIEWRWGLDEAALTAFCADYSVSEAGKSKRVSLNRRQDGRYDVIGTVETITENASPLSATIGAAWDTTEYIEWRWGLSQAALELFLAGYETNEEGKRKSVSVNRRADGFFDAVGRVEQTSDNLDELVAVVGAAWDTLETTTWKWGLTSAEVDVFTALYSAQEEGKTKSVSVNRRADGKFDVVARVAETSVASDTVTATVGAAWDTSEVTVWKWGLSESELNTFTSGYATQEDGKTKSVSINRRSDGKFDAVGREANSAISTDTITATVGAAWDTTETTVWKWGMTEAELNTFTSGYATQEDGKTKSVSVNRRSDGYFDAVGRVSISAITTDEVTATVGAAWDTTETTVWKWGMTEAELNTFTSGYATQEDGKTKSVSVNRRSDGYFDAVGRIASTEVTSATFSATVGAAWDTSETTVWQWGLTEAELGVFTALYATQEDGKTKSVSVNRRSDGYFDAVGRVSTSAITTDEVTATVGAAWDTTETTVWKWGMTEAELNSFTSGYATQEDGKTKSVSVNRRSDGYFDAVGRVSTSAITTDEVTATVGAAWDTTETTVWKWGMTEAELNTFTSGYATQEDGKTKSVSVNRRSDGYFDAVGRVATSSISVAEFIATIGAAWDTSETITWKWGLTEVELTSFAAGYATQEDGVTKSLSINRRSDGYFDAVGREADTEISVATVTATVGQSWDSVEVTIWKWGLTLAELDDFTATYSAQEDGITKSVSVNRRSDGYFDAVGRTLTTTIATATFTAIVGSAWDEVTTTVWEWGLTEVEVTAFVGGYSASETGKRKSVEVNRRADGKYDAVARVVQSNSAENLTVTIAETSFSTETRVYNWGVDPDDLAALLTAFESATARSRKAVNVSRRQDGNYDVVLSTTATTERAGETSTVSRTQSATRTIFVNAENPPGELSGYGEVHYVQNELGGYDGWTEAVTYISTDDDDAGPGAVNTIYQVYADGDDRSGNRVYFAKVPYKIGVRSTQSYRKAHEYAFGSGEDFTVPGGMSVGSWLPLMGTPVGDSHVAAIGGGKYIAKRVMDRGTAEQQVFSHTVGDASEPEV